jgi:hypothetical protein
MGFLKLEKSVEALRVEYLELLAIAAIHFE